MKPLRSFLFVLVAALAFAGGYGYGRWYATGAGRTNGGQILYYVDPMHPAYKSDKPGIAPDCGMKLVPVYSDEAAGRQRKDPDPPGPPHESETTGKMNADTDPVDTSALPMGAIKISQEKQQLIGVRYGTVESATGVHTFRAVGKVGYDETRIARVHAKVEGWIDQVFVDFTGKLVENGQPLLTLYSPDMLATQQEFLLALKGKDLLKNSTLPGVPEQGDALIEAARRRLELWDLSESQIDEIARAGRPVKTVTLESPISGYVTARNAFPKQRIMPDTELYTVVNLSRVWIMADVFENEVPMLRIGQAASITLSYTPGRALRAKVNYIQPEVDPMTRALKIRLEAENPGLVLKPDMYVDVEFRVDMPRRLTVPSDAVLDAGLRKTVFVDRGNGFLEPRQVEIGERLGDQIEILKGLRAGERIVTSGNFLIDSESQLKSAASGMAGMPGMFGLAPDSRSSKGSSPPFGDARPSGQPGRPTAPGMPGVPELKHDQPGH